MNEIYKKWKDDIDGKTSDKVANIIESEKYVKATQEEYMKVLSNVMKEQCQEIRENLNSLNDLMKTVQEIGDWKQKEKLMNPLVKSLEAQLTILAHVSNPKLVIEETK